MNRKLGAGERVTWLTAQAGSVNFVVIARVAGPVNESVVREALNLLSQRHPLLKTRIKVEDQPEFTSENVPEIPLRVEARRDDEHWQSEAEKEVNQPLPWSTGPLVKVVLLKGTKVNDLLIAFHHVIGDAMSGIYLVRDLLSMAEHIAGGNTPVVQPLPERPPVEDLLPESAHGVDGQVKTASLLGKQLVNMIQRPKKLPKDGDSSSKDLRARNIYRVLTPEETERFITRCREESTTVHGAICAAVLKAAANQIHSPDGKPITISCMSMVDLRQFLNPPIGEEVGFYVSAIITVHRFSTDTEFWDLARSAREAVHQSLEKGEPFVSLSLLNKLAPKNITPEGLTRIISRMYPSAVMVTNAGRLDIPEQYGPFALEDLHVAVANTSTPEFFNIALHTYSGKLTMSFFYAEPVVSQTRAAALVEDTMEILQSVCGSG